MATGLGRIAAASRPKAHHTGKGHSGTRPSHASPCAPSCAGRATGWWDRSVETADAPPHTDAVGPNHRRPRTSSRLSPSTCANRGVRAGEHGGKNHCGPVGIRKAEIEVNKYRSGAILQIELGPASMRCCTQGRESRSPLRSPDCCPAIPRIRSSRACTEFRPQAISSTTVHPAATDATAAVGTAARGAVMDVRGSAIDLSDEERDRSLEAVTRPSTGPPRWPGRSQRLQRARWPQCSRGIRRAGQPSWLYTP